MCISIIDATHKRLDEFQGMWRKQSDFDDDDLALQLTSKGCWDKSITKFLHGAA